MTEILSAADDSSLDQALRVLAEGGLVAIPTETVYGLAADATNDGAVARIYEVKGRPHFNPLIIHCADWEMAERFGVFSEAARQCAKEFWPGGLTLVVPYRAEAEISPLVLAGLSTIAIRVPKGISAQVIAKLGRPLAAPSANLSGRVSPTQAQHVQDQLGGRVDCILDDGPSAIGVESTIISFDEAKPVLLRPGGIEAEAIEKLFGQPLQEVGSDTKIAAPGMLRSHYAPLGSVRLQAENMANEEGALNFGASALVADHMQNLSEKGDLREAAANLFRALADFDALGVKSIAVAPIPQEGLGLAINDRLRRAAAPRD